MNSPEYQVRRATVDDLPQLVELWKLERLPHDRLAKQFTEFQVVVDPSGRVLGALGLQIVAQQGYVHSESFLQFDMAETLRDLLWPRILAVAQNFGLIRLWSIEKNVFWHENGFQVAGPDSLAKLPPAFAVDRAVWSVMELRPELPPGVLSPDKEFAIFKEFNRAETDRVFAQARFLKILATLIAGALLVAVVVMGIILIKKMPPTR